MLVGASHGPTIVTGGFRPGQTRQFGYFVRAVAAIGAWRNVLLAPLTVRRQDGGEFAVFASEDGWVRLY